MFGKLLILILAVALTGAMLLVMRQHRVDAAFQTSGLHRELLQHEQTLWDARRAVAEATRPDAIRDMLDDTQLTWTPLKLDTDRLLHAASLTPPDAPDADTFIVPDRGGAAQPAEGVDEAPRHPAPDDPAAPSGDARAAD